MNDEIKEILDYYRNIVNDKKETYTVISRDIFYLEQLLDYITNLQHTKDLYNQLLKDYDELEQAYQELKDSKQWWNNRFNAVQRDYEDYKSRIEKAVEYIQNHQLVFELSSKKVISQWFDMFYKDTLNILNGRSDE